MKIAPVFLFLLLVTGCANQNRIHIFNEGFDPEAVSRVANLLNDQGFDARTNELPVPASIARHTVIYPAIVEDFAVIESIESVLKSSGFANPRLIRESEANHFFSTSNIGIYLVNPDVEYDPLASIGDPYSLGDVSLGEQETDLKLTYNYFSECPAGSEAQSELNLYPGGTAIIEEFVWDEDLQNEISRLHDGEWSVKARDLSIDIFDSGNLQYSITKHKGSNWQGAYDGITLLAQASTANFENCNYTHLIYTNQR